MNVQIIYLTKKDRKLSGIAKDIAFNITNKLQSLTREIEKENAGIFIYFGDGHSKIKIKASSKLEHAISMLI
ncbi:MAG: hypothetical protein JWN83_345 [Chitinophagaceae bacterium]|nr:hypothetical protein [Chitinophagaceae bacterium]